MRIIAKILGEDSKLVEDLIKHSVSAKLVKGAVIAELPSLKGSQKYEIPKEVCNATLCIDICEFGDGMTYYGKGTVVCDLNGLALRPYYVPHNINLANHTHAYFSVPDSVATITGDSIKKTITIEEHHIVREGTLARIESNEIWTGNLQKLPNMYIKFQSAGKAAEKKCNHYHCHDVHYAIID